MFKIIYKIVASLFATVILLLCVTACDIDKTASNNYTVASAVYSEGVVYTPDGNIWVCDASVPDGCQVTVQFSNNETPDNIYDDIILSIVPEVDKF